MQLNCRSGGKSCQSIVTQNTCSELCGGLWTWHYAEGKLAHRQGESKQRELVVAEPTSWIDQVFGFVGFIKDLRTAVQITVAIQRLRYHADLYL